MATSSVENGRLVVLGALSNGSSFVIRFGARAAFLWVAAHLYGSTPYGVFSMASTAVELMAPIAGLSLKRMIFPWLELEAPQRGAGHVLADALMLTVIASAVVATVVAIGATLLPAGAISPSLRFALIVLAPAALGQAVADVAFAATRWTNRMRYEVLGRGLVEPYTLTAVTVGAWLIGNSDSGLLIGYGTASAVVAAFAIWSARRCLGPLGLTQWRPHALVLRLRTLTSPSGADFLAALSQRIDLVLVGFLLNDAAAGLYNVLRQLRTPISQVRQAFDGILTPLTARTMHADGTIYAGQAMGAASRVILTIQLAIVLAVTAGAGPVLALLGPQYPPVWAALVAMMMAETVNGAFGVSELILYYRRPSLALRVNLLLIAIPTLLIPVAAPRFGLLGASTAMLVAAFAATALRRVWLTRLGIHHHAKHSAPPLLAVLAGATVWLAMKAALPSAASLPLGFLPPLAALGTYAALIQWWRRTNPAALALAQFRVK